MASTEPYNVTADASAKNMVVGTEQVGMPNEVDGPNQAGAQPQPDAPVQPESSNQPHQLFAPPPGDVGPGVEPAPPGRAIDPLDVLSDSNGMSLSMSASASRSKKRRCRRKKLEEAIQSELVMLRNANQQQQQQQRMQPMPMRFDVPPQGMGGPTQQPTTVSVVMLDGSGSMLLPPQQPQQQQGPQPQPMHPHTVPSANFTYVQQGAVPMGFPQQHMHHQQIMFGGMPQFAAPQVANQRPQGAPQMVSIGPGTGPFHPAQQANFGRPMQSGTQVFVVPNGPTSNPYQNSTGNSNAPM